MMTKLLKLKANEAMSSGAVETSTWGIVIERNMRQRPAPSMRAASTRSAGMDCSAPVHTRSQYG